ncbi:ABC-transporter [Coprinopsis marcescibilis]|uniref:ABC-transporter n=1 Tax=Coprinopsis marcescibilis TaxID=230819 RepID=A0A5C3L254_COPMA|nr:ABC-transporter [Coprinopsis marcescibilis]
MASTPAETITLNDYPQVSRNGSPQNHPTDDVVARAEADFNALSRTLSRSSRRSKRQTSSNDLEKADSDGDDSDRFDLREYLTSSNDANQQAGIKHKRVGVVWEDLEVEVPEHNENKIIVPTLADSIWDFFIAPLTWIWALFSYITPLKKKEERTEPIIHKATGVLKPGEMCLVLGCPGAGCTTFLKAIANQREEFAKVTGNVLYAGIEAEEMHKHYKGEVVFNHEDDLHIPTLTVGQTLQFALSMKAPGPNGRLPGLSKKDFNREVEDTLLRMLNISHTKDTLVGDEFVRGVSGGERKRVSIAEMMATRARVQCWDNSTRGLDASTALDFVRSLRVMTDVLGQTTFVTLYQASESIYQLFDKVLLIDGGRQVFYGSPSEARAYFEGLGYNPLPRQTTADYLTGCTDPNERQFAPGRSSNDTPSTPADLETSYLQSRFGVETNKAAQEHKRFMESEKSDQEAFRAAVAADKKRGVSSRSPYTLGFSGQVWALTKRQFQTRLQDDFQLKTGYFFTLVLALLIGGSFFQLPLSSNGAFTRGALIFTALMVTCLDAFAELPTQMVGRPIVRKQTDYSMYRASAISLANLLADMPFSASRVLMYNIIVYFMAGLHRSAGAFFTFHLFNYLAFLAIQGLFRTLGLLCFDFNAAFRLAVFFFPNFVQYCGYLIPILEMKRWLFWISYVNPLGYAWGACMENEFSRIAFPCDGASVVPRNGFGVDKFPLDLGANQACTLFGSQPGTSLIQGVDYLKVGYDLNVADLWRLNLPVLIAIFLFFQAAQIFVLEYYPQFGFGAHIRIHAPENDEIRALNAAQEAKKVEREALREKEKIVNASQSKSSLKHSGRVLTWEKLNYHVPVASGQLRLLHDVNGYVKPGTLTALMGASGAGKTTCLDVLAQRKNIGVISGDVLVDGRPLPLDFARGTAYAEQMDVHEGTATVREALRFSAYLRQPESVPIEEKNAYVEELIELLELQDLTETLVFSLSVESRKRLTIGVELAAKPELLLFLDEPTSGLDAQSAWNLVRFLRKLADQGQAILCTIHQPSALLFESFDRLLLLQRGGETVYFGDIGSDSRVIRDYFADHGAVCPPDVNPAEYMLEAIGAGVTPRIGDKDWKDVWLESPEHKQVLREIEEIKTQALERPEPKKGDVSTYATSFVYQLRVVSWRNTLALWRTPNFIFTRLFVCSFISLFISLSFLQLGTSVRDLQHRVFSIFWLIVLPSILLTQTIPAFIFARRTFIREASGRIYSPYVFAIAQLLGEVPYSILCAILYWVLMVYPTGFGQGSAGLNGTGFQLIPTIFMVLFGVSLGQLIGALSPSIQVGVLSVPTINLVLATFCGVNIPYPALPSYWYWIYELNPLTRTMASMISTEFAGLVIRCKSDEFAIFSPPAGETCLTWAQEFVSVAGGYLDNPNSTTDCRYCQYKSGEEFFLPLNIRFDNRWRDVWIFFAFIVFNLVATVVASRFLRYAKR